MEDNNPVLTSKKDVAEPQEETSWGKLGIHAYIKIAIVAGLMIHLYYSGIYSIVSKWISDSSWSHGFLIPFFNMFTTSARPSTIITSSDSVVLT